MKVEVDVLGSPSQIVCRVSVDVKHHRRKCVCSEIRSCVKVEEDILGSPSQIVCTVSVDVKQH